MTTKRFEELLQKVRKNDSDWVPPSRLLALDPGETTGVALFEHGYYRESVQWRTKNDYATNMFSSLEDLFQIYRPTHIVCEDYKVYGHKTEDHSWSSLHTPQLIGAIRMLAHLSEIPVNFQMASQAKGFCKDEKLKNWGMYEANLKHARDAVRHGCYFLLFNSPGDTK